MSANSLAKAQSGPPLQGTVEDMEQRDIQAALFEKVVIGGNLAGLTESERVQYYIHRCNAAGLDPRTQPFGYLNLQGKLTLYATKTATEQYAAKYRVSVDIISKTLDSENGIFEVEAVAYDPIGRRVMNLGAVSVAGLKGEHLCNARMKAVTKASRRAIIAYGGLGVIDESEIDSIEDARIVQVDAEGRIIGPIGGIQQGALPAAQRPRHSSVRRASRASVIETTATTEEPEVEDEAALRERARTRIGDAFRKVTGLPYAGNNGESKRFADYCKATIGTEKKWAEMSLEELASIADLIEAVPTVRDHCYLLAKTHSWDAVRSYLASLGLELNADEGYVTHPEWVKALALLQSQQEAPADDTVHTAEIVDDEQQGGLQFGEGD